MLLTDVNPQDAKIKNIVIGLCNDDLPALNAYIEQKKDPQDNPRWAELFEELKSRMDVSKRNIASHYSEVIHPGAGPATTPNTLSIVSAVGSMAGAIHDFWEQVEEKRGDKPAKPRLMLHKHTDKIIGKAIALRDILMKDFQVPRDNFTPSFFSREAPYYRE